jgi:hypothetical protein
MTNSVILNEVKNLPMMGSFVSLRMTNFSLLTFSALFNPKLKTVIFNALRVFSFKRNEEA